MIDDHNKDHVMSPGPGSIATLAQHSTPWEHAGSFGSGAVGTTLEGIAAVLGAHLELVPNETPEPEPANA
jgi:hypothetical protein